jgi:hypothetical protein
VRAASSFCALMTSTLTAAVFTAASLACTAATA